MQAAFRRTLSRLVGWLALCSGVVRRKRTSRQDRTTDDDWTDRLTPSQHPMGALRARGTPKPRLARTTTSPTWPPDRVTGWKRLGNALRPGPVAIATLAPQRWPRLPDSRLLPTAPSRGGRPPTPVTPEEPGGVCVVNRYGRLNCTVSQTRSPLGPMHASVASVVHRWRHFHVYKWNANSRDE